MFKRLWAEVERQVLEGHSVLTTLLRAGDMQHPDNSGHRTWGREAEGQVVNLFSGCPSPIVTKLLAASHGPRNGHPTPPSRDALSALIVKEVHDAMVEFNKPVRVLKPNVFRTSVADDRHRFNQFRQYAAPYDSDLLLVGTSPGADWSHFDMGYYVDGDRYRQLLYGLAQALGNDGIYDIVIPAENVPSTNRHRRKGRFSLAGIVNSDQVQIQMGADEVGQMVNWAHILMGPIAAMFANATCFAGKIFDSASARPQIWRCLTAGKTGFRKRHNYFLDEWLPEGNPEAFSVWVSKQLNHDAIVDCMDADPLNCLKLFLSVWSWIRPKFDMEPVPNVRMEVRGIDRQFTPEDSCALYALLLGALTHVVKAKLDVRDYMTPEQARCNFLQGAHYGILNEDASGNRIEEHRLCWKGGKATARAIVANDILKWAKLGLELLEFTGDEINEALYPVRRIVVEGAPCGAQWIRTQMRTLRRRHPDEADIELGRRLVLDMVHKTWTTKKPGPDWGPVA